MTDIIEKLQRMIDHNRGMIKKGRVYLRPGEPEPEGMKISTGPHGGRYYDTSSISPKHAYREIMTARKDSPGWLDDYWSRPMDYEKLHRAHLNNKDGDRSYDQKTKPGTHRVSITDRHRKIDTIPAEDEEETRRKWWKKRKKNSKKYAADNTEGIIKRFDDIQTINNDFQVLKRKNPAHFKTFTESPGRMDWDLSLPKVRGKWKPHNKHRSTDSDGTPRNKAKSDREEYGDTLWNLITGK